MDRTLETVPARDPADVEEERRLASLAEVQGEFARAEGVTGDVRPAGRKEASETDAGSPDSSGNEGAESGLHGVESPRRSIKQEDYWAAGEENYEQEMELARKDASAAENRPDYWATAVPGDVADGKEVDSAGLRVAEPVLGQVPETHAGPEPNGRPERVTVEDAVGVVAAGGGTSPAAIVETVARTQPDDTGTGVPVDNEQFTASPNGSGNGDHPQELPFAGEANSEQAATGRPDDAVVIVNETLPAAPDEADKPDALAEPETQTLKPDLNQNSATTRQNIQGSLYALAGYVREHPDVASLHDRRQDTDYQALEVQADGQNAVGSYCLYTRASNLASKAERIYDEQLTQAMSPHNGHVPSANGSSANGNGSVDAMGGHESPEIFESKLIEQTLLRETYEPSFVFTWDRTNSKDENLFMRGEIKPIEPQDVDRREEVVRLMVPMRQVLATQFLDLPMGDMPHEMLLHVGQPVHDFDDGRSNSEMPAYLTTTLRFQSDGNTLFWNGLWHEMSDGQGKPVTREQDTAARFELLDQATGKKIHPVNPVSRVIFDTYSIGKAVNSSIFVLARPNYVESDPEMIDDGSENYTEPVENHGGGLLTKVRKTAFDTGGRLARIILNN